MTGWCSAAVVLTGHTMFSSYIDQLISIQQQSLGFPLTRPAFNELIVEKFGCNSALLLSISQTTTVPFLIPIEAVPLPASGSCPQLLNTTAASMVCPSALTAPCLSPLQSGIPFNCHQKGHSSEQNSILTQTTSLPVPSCQHATRATKNSGELTKAHRAVSHSNSPGRG